MTDNDFDKLLTSALLEAAEIDYCGDIPSDEELDALITPSKRFERRMQKLIKNPKAYARNLKRPIYIKALRTAAMILLAISITFGAAMLNPTARAWVERVVATWFDDRTEYKITEESGAHVPSDWVFGYIPEGFEREFEHINELTFNVEYYNSDGVNVGISINRVANVNIDNEHSEYYRIEIRGEPVDIYQTNTPDYPSHLIWYWSGEDVIVNISGYVGVEELIKIAENIER